MIRTLLAAVAAGGILAAGAAQAQEKLKIGVLATLEGALTTLGEDAMRGLQVAMKQANAKAGGKTSRSSPSRPMRARIRRSAAPASSSSRTRSHPDRAGVGIGRHRHPRLLQDAAAGDLHQRLLGRHGDDLSSRRRRISSASTPTARSGWSGLGEYIFEEKKYKKIAALAEDYSFPYTQLFGLTLEYCQAGGQIVERFWVPLGTKDFGSIIAKLPDDVDAIYLGLGGGDAVNFLNQYSPGRRQGEAHRRLDHGRPDRAELEGRRQARSRSACPPAVRRPTPGTIRNGRPG